MIAVQCAICRVRQDIDILYNERIDRKKITAKTFSARRTPDRMHHRFVRCRRCGLIFSNPILPPKKVLDLYKKSDFTYTQESEFLGKTYLDYCKQYVFPKKTKDLSLLDIGCGNGFFLEKINTFGLTNIAGVEPGRESVKKAPTHIRNKIKVDVLRPKLFKKETFDIVSCFHTLDHIIDPNAFIQEVYKLVKKGGKVFFVVHNTDGLSVKLLGEKSPIFDIEHIYLFNPNTLTKIFANNGFSQIRIVNIKNTYPLLYWFRLLPIPHRLKSLVMDFLKITKIGLLPFSLSAGNIGIIAKK